MAKLLHANATISCPHGGTASLQNAQTRVAASGQFAADLSSRWVITGCPFTVGTGPRPCVTIQWITAAARVSVLGNNVVTQASSAVCLSADGIPQRAPIIAVMQQRVTAM